ncbi:hypothetical protein HY29_15320 [Hyphomonas beringensis]|uniref:Universal stress protein B n=1 Tax=Hyphomonas beringensis TaxID=1280946 RepID=A0A062U7G7_9PROT|nr:hypothetical protein [Hyphomonas beringensis]KCZ54207.1 hypothetical protein HY29_15320 [Hyphomonas beringensis]
MTAIVLFILLGLTCFALLLALQMRWLISTALRRGLADKFGGQYTDLKYRQGVADAGRLVEHTEVATYLNQTYPQQLSHLRLARKVSVLSLPIIIALLVILRFGLEAF